MKFLKEVEHCQRCLFHLIRLLSNLSKYLSMEYRPDRETYNFLFYTIMQQYYRAMDAKTFSS